MAVWPDGLGCTDLGLQHLDQPAVLLAVPKRVDVELKDIGLPMQACDEAGDGLAFDQRNIADRVGHEKRKIAFLRLLARLRSLGANTIER
ncbi:hypothetical protein D3C72_2290070 [compost metagenome]